MMKGNFEKEICSESAAGQVEEEVSKILMMPGKSIEGTKFRQILDKKENIIALSNHRNFLKLTRKTHQNNDGPVHEKYVIKNKALASKDEDSLIRQC